MSLRKVTLNGFLWLGGVKASNAILQFGILAILARLLTPTEFGLMGLALIVVSFADIFTDLGFGPAITQKKELSKTDIHTGFTYSVIFGFLLFVTLWLLAPLISGFFQNDKLTPILKTISVVLLLKSITTTPLGLMYRNLEYKMLSLIQICSYALGYGGIGIILAFNGFGVWSLVFAVLGQTLISLTLYVFFSKGILGISFNKHSFKSLLYFGGGYSLSKIFTYVGNKGDKIIVGRMLGVDALGLYERGYQLVKFLSSQLGEVIDKVLFSPIAKRQDDRQLVGKVFLEMTYILSIIFFPLSVFLYNNAESIVLLLLGDQWGGTVTIVKIMSVTVFFLICTRVGATVAKSLGDVYRRAIRSFIYAVLIVIGTYFASQWGIDGVVIVVTIAIIINYFMAFAQINKLTKIGVLSFLVAHFFGFALAIVYQILLFLITTIYPSISDLNLLFQLFLNLMLLFVLYSVSIIFDNKKIIQKYSKVLFNPK